MDAPAPAAPPVAVVVDDSPSTPPMTDAVRWAAREAVRRRVTLRILTPAGGEPGRRRAALVRALVAARRAARRVTVQTVLSDETPARTARIASAEAAVIVLSGPAAVVDELVTRAHCPLVVVPPGRGGDRPGPVLLGVGPATPDAVVAFAFAEAEARGAEVVAVRTWHHPLVDLGVLTGDRIARWDAADTAQRQDLADRLSLAAIAYPDVPLRLHVVDDHCADLLADLAARAALLVLGRPARGAALGLLRPSPAATLARIAPCPVAVVPPAGPLRSTLLPGRPVGVADLRP